MQFENMNIINCSLNMVYPRKVKIGEKLSPFLQQPGSALEDLYLTPQILGIPNDIDPEVPRIILDAVNRHNQITVSQVNSRLNCNFDFRYQGDISKSFNYARQRAEVLQSLVKAGDIHDVLYQGVTATVQFPQDAGDHEITSYLLEKFNQKVSTAHQLNEYNQKITFIYNDEYYINLVIGNYRNFNFTNQHDSPLTASLAEAKLLDKGVFVSIDINNRYKFNKDGEPSQKTIEEISNDLFNFTEEFLTQKVVKILEEGEIFI